MATAPGSNELRLTRVYDAPARAVWDAWTVPGQIERWWGPRGFTLTTHAKDLRAGGAWRYTMHGPDGVDHPNVTRYLAVEPCRRLVYDHGGTDDRPALFRVTATFAEAEGRTTLEVVSALPSPEAAAQMAGFIRQAGGDATWDRLAEHLAGRPTFVTTRTFDAPAPRVFEHWTTPDLLARWLPPAGLSMRFLRAEIAPGKGTLFVMAAEGFSMHVRCDYLAVEPPRRLAYAQQFVDAQERPAPAPGAEVWPATLRNTVVLAEEAPGRTRVTVTTEPEGRVTPAEVEAFLGERPGMTMGWTGSFDALEALLGAGR